MYTTDIIAKAQAYAYKAHDGLHLETLSGFKRPQLLHIQEVVDLVWASGGTSAEIAAAWLHDAVEDTSATHGEIEKEFGKEIAELVYGLTDLDDWLTLSVVERKAKQAERVAKESESVRRIKLADQTSNVRCITLDALTTMTPGENARYIVAAKKIADACKGVSPFLDRLFDEMYRLGSERYKT